MKHPTAAVGPQGIAAPSHLLPGHKFTRGFPSARLGEPQAGSCAPNPPHPQEKGEERQEKQPPCPSKLTAPNSWQGTSGRASPRKAASCGNVVADPLGGCSVQCKMSHVPLQRHRPREAIPRGPALRRFGLCLCCSGPTGERIPAGRGEGEQGRRRLASADKDFSMSSIGICRFRCVGRV